MRNEMVPLAERLRYMQWFRAATAVIVALTWLLSPGTSQVDAAAAAAALAGYLLVSGACEVLWRRMQRRGLLLFGGMLLVDGIFLAWSAYATGSSSSPLRYLILAHVVVVTLCASYRTGLKLALWHSLLLFVTFHAQEAGLVKAVDTANRALPGTEYQRLLTFVGATWLVALSTALFSAVNERELRRRRLDLEALAQMAGALEKVHEPSAVGKVLVDTLSDTFGFGRIVVVGEPRGDPTLLAHRGTRSTGPMEPGIDVVVKDAWDRRETLRLSGIDDESNPRLTALLPNARNLLITPLLAEDRPIGVLAAEHSMRRGTRIEERVVSMVNQFAAHVALALDNAWLLEHVQEMAETDGLTGVANRRSFETILDREMTRAYRNSDKLSLVLADIDHFKRLNDTYGHQAGDDVLRTVAAALRAQCRDVDTVARYGGEEFAIILPGCPESNAVETAERLRQAVEDANTSVPVTISAGVATYPLHAADRTRLIEASDEALYESKRSGRNRVTQAVVTEQAAAVGVGVSGSGGAVP